MSVRYKQSLTSAVLFLSLAACGGGGGSTGSTADAGATPRGYSLSGQVQKGPFIFGSNVWVAELDANLDPTGRTFVSQTSDDLGNFAVSPLIGTPLVELVGDGFYMDEITGNLSLSRVVLRAVADLSSTATPTINVLTTLQAPRLKALMRTGLSFRAAEAQSQNEVLAAFGIDATRVDGFRNLYGMSIVGGNDADSVLLAISSVLSRMAADAAGSSGTSSAQLSFLLSRIASDIAADGSLNDAATVTARANAAAALDLTTVRSNVETYYASRGLTITAPKFEEWVDKDRSGVLPRRVVPTPGLTFTPVVNGDALRELTSNPVSVTGVGGQTVRVEVSAGTTLVKNGSVVSGRFSTAVEGDTLALRQTSPNFGGTATAQIRVGSTASSWSVGTRVPTVIELVSGVSPSPSPVSASRFYAQPFIAAQTRSARYLGIALGSSAGTYWGARPTAVAIYSNDASSTPEKPLAPIATSSQIAPYFVTSLPLASGGTVSFPPLSSTVVNSILTSGGNASTAVFFGAQGVPLVAGQRYWIVVDFGSTSATAYGMKGLSGSNPFSRRLASVDGINWNDWNFLGQTDTTVPVNHHITD